MSLPDGYAFVAAGSDFGKTARRLLDSADRAGVDQTLVRTISGGFQAPESVVDDYNGHKDDDVEVGQHPLDIPLEKDPNDYHGEPFLPEVTIADGGQHEPAEQPAVDASIGAGMESSIADDATAENVTPTATEPPAQEERGDLGTDRPDTGAETVAENPADDDSANVTVDENASPEQNEAPAVETAAPELVADDTTPAQAEAAVEAKPALAEPAGNASAADWLAYARQQSTYDNDTDASLSRDALKEKFGSK